MEESIQSASAVGEVLLLQKRGCPQETFNCRASAVGPADKAGQNLGLWSTPTLLSQLPGAKAVSTSSGDRRWASGDAQEHVGLNTYVRLWTRTAQD